MTSALTTGTQHDVLESYPLVSLQPAMLVNHLRAPRSGVDIVQMVSELCEAVNVAALRNAWERVSERHPALRTVFRWEDVVDPVQEVHAAALPEISVLDWSGVDSGAAETALHEFLARDRVAGFDMRVPPLQRVTLIELGESEWRMVWTFHHALIDGRAFAIVLREVMALYDGRETVDSLPDVRPIRDFAEWFAAQNFSISESFWRDQLGGFPAATPLPAPVTDASALASASGRGLHHRWLAREASAQLIALAKAKGLTINNIIQGAWALMLGLHSGDDDVVFGATRAGRKGTIAGADEMVGLFINTVPVRARIERDKPFVEWLGALRETWRSLFAAEHTPLRLVQRWSDVGTASPLFNSQIVFESLPLKATMHAMDPALSQRGFQLYGGTNFPLTGLLYGGDQFSLEIEHDRTVIDDATAIRLIEQLRSLLESMAANPRATVGELCALPDAERGLVVSQWNDTSVAFPNDITLVDLLSRQAAETPNAVAVRDELRSLTYVELDAHACRLAAQLAQRGAGRDKLVAVCAERSVELVIALVAIIKSGAAYVPLDPEYPADRLAFMLEDAAAPILIAHRRVADGLPADGAQTLCLDDVFEQSSAHAVDVRDHAPAPHDLAYMIYTSGSTGRPKGALNEHRGIVNRLLWMQAEYSLGVTDVVLQKTPFSFDVSVWEFFWPLISGATLVMAKPGGHRDTGYLAETIQKYGITVCHFVPSMLRAFLADETAARCTSLRDVMASGEALPPDLVATFARTLPGTRLHNLYGPTECAVDVSYWPCPQAVSDLTVVPIGRPVANTQLYILDQTGAPVPIGVAGELYLGGVQVGRGYHNRPELTAERFVANPFLAGENARMYRTGDRARWRADGTIEYLGRLDFQVKIRGFRIELGEIESALLAHPSIRDVVVVAHGAGDAHRLVAYVVAEGPPPSLVALRDHLLIGLPDYMVPAMFVWLPVLPLSSNGKVDRRALPDPGIERESLSRAYAAPRNERERLLADVWCRVLRLDTVGVDDNFFELGGDSLLGVQILANAAPRGLRLTLTQLLRNPTVSALAALGESTVSVAEVREVTGAVPLTPVQHWFFESQ
ncbi:MAG: amino acid adenylation domain-containing protein, partial [Gemmatimonadaceae bacterium]